MVEVDGFDECPIGLKSSRRRPTNRGLGFQRAEEPPVEAKSTC